MNNYLAVKTAGIKTRLNVFFSKGHERTLLAKKNISLSFLIKIFGILIGFLLMPLTIKYINPAQYGIWLTLSVLIGWMNFFDIGLGNGLRNKLAEANALGQNSNSRVYVSTTYAILTLISVGMLLLFIIINPFIHWSKILNTGSIIINANGLALLAIELFCLQFVAQLINSVLTACHRIANVSLLLLIGQLVTVVGVIGLLKFTHSSLFLLVLVNGCAPLVALTAGSIWYYKTDLKALSPSIKFVDFTYVRELLSLGGVFFIIQLGALVLFQTDNIVIVQLFGPAQVTNFNVAYRLFSVFTLGFNIIITPFWSAFTDAYAKDDLTWIKAALVKLRFLWVGLSFGAVVLFFAAPFIFKIWINNPLVKIPVSLSFAMVLYIIVYIWQTIHVYFLNGVNKIRLQLYLVIISALVNIPLAILLGRKIGLAGITLANAILFLIMGILFAYQTHKIVNGTATGIWNI